MLDQSLLPNNISLEQFQQLLGRYESLIESISSAKGAKPGQKTLLELEQFRYRDAVTAYGSEGSKSTMALNDVKTLVDWKLRHGKFRPTLMKLVSSNDDALVERIIREAVEEYRTSLDTSKAVRTITNLKGIGPATASLLLSVHDSHGVIFFSDEVFYWLCCNGQKSPIKYNAKEYQELSTTAQVLAKRLGVDAVDVEKVAYVLINEGASDATSGDAKTTSPSDVKPAQVDSSRKPAKRKSNISNDATDRQIQVRRSKRGKAS